MERNSVRKIYDKGPHRCSVPEVLVFVLDDGVFIHLTEVGDLAHAQDQNFARQLVGDG